MATKPGRGVESRSASSVLIPQLRHSRRGSMASISSTTQIDKETLSQALDEIHIAASQTDALTTFNEFTSPPSTSAGVSDNKGIASELQGGLSGLYNKLRASVGNAKEGSPSGTDGVGGEEFEIRDIGAESFSPSRQKDRDSSPLSLNIIDTNSVLDDKKSDRTIHGISGSSKTSIKDDESQYEKKQIRPSFASRLSSSMSMKTAHQNVESPIFEEGISKAASLGGRKQLPRTTETVQNGSRSGGYNQLGEGQRFHSKQGVEHTISPLATSSMIAVEQPGTKFDAPIRSPTSSKSVQEEDKSRVAEGMEDTRIPAKSHKINIETIQTLRESVPAGEKKDEGHDPKDQMAVKVPSLKDDRKAETWSPQANQEASEGGKTVRTPEKKGKLQHLELASRRSLAPPLISREEYSPGPPISRTPSTETNPDSIASNSRPFAQSTPRSGLRSGVESPLPLGEAAPFPRHRRDPQTIKIISHAKNKVLNKEYWMKDENARDCFHCGEPFTTFRRKHHCRICGQIFDAKCTATVNGERFGHPGTIRVCVPCEGYINRNDDSSDFSEDDNSLPTPALRPRHGSTGANDAFPSPLPGGSPNYPGRPRKNTSYQDLSVPTMSIPATRKSGEKTHRKSTVLEIGSMHSLTRPSSSRSLKSSMAGKPYSSGHRRHNSRHLAQRSFKPVQEHDAPFHQDATDVKSNTTHLPAFHDDNIIDPDLAPYLSDEASSGDEQMSIMAALNGDGLSRSQDNDRPSLSALTSSSKRARSRLGEKSLSAVTFASRDTDTHSLHSAKMTNPGRSLKRRNMSFTGSSHMRPSMRSRLNLAASGLGAASHDGNSVYGPYQLNSPAYNPSRMMRSSSMRGDAAPILELNDASLRHVQRLLKQLLEDSKVPNASAWEKALIPMLLRVTDDVNPNIPNGDDIDIRHYVKLKKIPGGRPGDTAYVSGLVFTKNLALKSMPRNIPHPNILILTFPLEYARHQQHFMSLEPVIRQEREFLQNLVNRIMALRPHLLLVERHVSGLALEFLEQAGIATAYNVKPSVLEAVSRCCQTRIISSVDKLAMAPAQVGKCANFYLKTYVNRGRKKTYMFLSGCAKELGCTIVLRGDAEAVLSKMKRITEFMIYVVYNLKLETSLMRDEFASIPSATEVGSLSIRTDNRLQSIPVPHSHSDNLPKKGTETLASAQMEQSEDKNFEKKDIDKAEGSKEGKISLPEEDSVPDDIPMPTYYSDMVEEQKTKILSASPFVKFAQPYLLMRSREQERRLAYLKRLCDQDLLEDQKGEEKPKMEKFDLIKPEMIHEIVPHASRKVREVLHAVHDAEYDKALHIYQTQCRQWESYIAGSLDLFEPYAHQNIAVLYSVVCTVTTVPCAGPDMLALGFYNEHEADADFEADCTLGQYVEDLCMSANTICTSNGCEKKMLEHHRQYVHGEAQLSVFVERYPCRLDGLQDSILMWSVCRICGAETQVLGMSENTWKYSFGKYLELSFWSSDLRASADICPHDLHRDHLRYFGFKDLALRVQYDPINLLEIIVPRTRITWKVDNDLRFKNDLFTRLEERLNKFMFSVKSRIKGINTQSVLPEKMEACKEEIERLSKKASDEHYSLIQKLRKRYMNSKHFEIIPLNRALRATQEKVAEWDNAFADFDRNFFPSEKDIRRLATLQLRSIFLESDQSVKNASASEDGSTTPKSQEALAEKSSINIIPAFTLQTRDMSPETAQDMLVSVMEKHVSTESPPDSTEHAQSLTETSEMKDANSAPEGVRPLDLALSPENQDLQSKLHSPPYSTSINEQNESTSKALPEPKLQQLHVSKRDDTTNSMESEQSAKPKPKFGDEVERNLPSGIPRPPETQKLPPRSAASNSSNRTQSQPANPRSNDSSPDEPKGVPMLQANSKIPKSTSGATSPTATTIKTPEKKLSDRLSLAGAVAQSMIPRSIARKKDSKVSSLARHFEQLSKEFERERLKERKQRAAKSRRSRAFPMAASKPIVQVYRNFHEAVEEKEPSVEDLISSDPSRMTQEETIKTSQAMAEKQVSETQGEGFHAEDTAVEVTDAEDQTVDESHTGTDLEGDRESDEDYNIFDDLQIPGLADEHLLIPEEAQLDLKLDLPKHEKTSLIKLLTNFWAERSASGWQPLEYPLNATDHIFADSDIIVREDEPSSLVALALSSEDYQMKLSSITDSTRASINQEENGQSDETSLDTNDQSTVEHSLLRPTGTHLKYQFSESSAKMLIKVFYAEQFDALRRKCGVSDRFVESLSRCMKWDSKGGKTKSVFLKTLDDRFVLKSLSPIETQAFLRFAPAYFRIMSESLFHDLPSVIAKMLGFYQVIIKNPVTGVEFNWFLLVMENLFYDRSPTRIFDLKGSMRNRRIQSTGEQNEVLLDENMVEFIYESPLFAREHSKKLLRASVWNDTLFLSRQNVMDYSLMIAIDENRKELVVGIIDCIRTYTWDKKLESWIKDRGKNRPTVTSPKEYKSRFREAMGRYVLQAPNCWHQFKAQQVELRPPLRMDDPGDDKEIQVAAL